VFLSSKAFRQTQQASGPHCDMVCAFIPRSRSPI
jgi:hypothetical protein